MDATLIGTIVTAICTIVVALIQTRRLHRSKREKRALEKEVDFLKLDFKIEVSAWNSLNTMVAKMFQKTAADRFLILISSNGKEAMFAASVIYEQHKSGAETMLSIGAIKKYVRFEYDSVYKDLLRSSEYYSPVNIEVAKLPDCDIKRIYDTEKVKHSSWFFHKRLSLNDSNDLIFYSSVATHQKASYSVADEIQIKTTMSRVKALIDRFEVSMR